MPNNTDIDWYFLSYALYT